MKGHYKWSILGVFSLLVLLCSVSVGTGMAADMSALVPNKTLFVGGDPSQYQDQHLELTYTVTGIAGLEGALYVSVTQPAAGGGMITYYVAGKKANGEPNWTTFRTPFFQGTFTSGDEGQKWVYGVGPDGNHEDYSDVLVNDGWVPPASVFNCSLLPNGNYTITVEYDLPTQTLVRTALVTVDRVCSGPLPVGDFSLDSGLVPGGVAEEATQVLRGVVPNPAGSSDIYGGKAYLVLNGQKIPLDVRKASEIRSVRCKDGSVGYEKDITSTWAAKTTTQREEGEGQWVFEVTFSLNAGPNTLQIQVYDLDGNLFAWTDTWEVMGTVRPSDLVVTLTWDTNGTDLDLHMSPDDGVTHCYYANKVAGDMVLDYDDTDGYGPEHITVSNVRGTKTYKIKVYYYADHNPPDDETTPTTAHVTARVGGELVLDRSHLMTVASTYSEWGSGPHIWDVGEVTVEGSNQYQVSIVDYDLSTYPRVVLHVTVQEPNDEGELVYVSGLTSENFYVVNAGMVMSPINVVDTGSEYDISYTDITSGKRDVYVYVYVPPRGNVPLKAGLSNKITYGKNYALLVGLNDYPPAPVPSDWSYYTSGLVTVDLTNCIDREPSGVDSFEIILKDEDGVYPEQHIVPYAMDNVSSGDTVMYRLSFDLPPHATEYEWGTVKYAECYDLKNCLNDVYDMENALVKTGEFRYSMWNDEDIQIITDSSATKSQVLGTIASIASEMNKYDAFLFFFSGHGSNGPDDDSQYICTYENDAWISVTDLASALNAIPKPGLGIANVFVFLDACFSGNFIGKGLQYPKGLLPKFRPFHPQKETFHLGSKVLEPEGFYKFVQMRDLTGDNVFVITANTGDKASWDDSALGNGVFTYYLVEGMNFSDYISMAPANANHDKWLSGEEAYYYCAPRAAAYVSPTNGYPTDASEQPQLRDNNSSLPARLLYLWND